MPKGKSMTRSEHRPKIALGDFLVVVAAIALGLSSLRITIPCTLIGGYRHTSPRGSHMPDGPLGAANPYVYSVLVSGVPLLVVASLTVVVLTLRPRRPTNPAPARGTGFVLCLAAVAASALTVVVRGPASWLHGDGYKSSVWQIIVFGIVPSAGHMVLGAWMALRLAAPRAPAPSRLDAFGRELGLIWVILFVLEYARLILEHAYLM
jgi:hypothetical protein